MVVDFMAYKKTHSLALSIPFGERIMVARKNQGWSQERLAARVGFDRSVISRWETGALEIRPQEVAGVARVLNNSEVLEHYCAECPVGATYTKLCRNPKPAA